MENKKDEIVSNINNVSEDLAENEQKETMECDNVNSQESDFSKDSDDILDGMREVMEYSDTTTTASDIVYVNDRDASDDVSEEKKSFIKKIYSSKIYRIGIKARDFLERKLRIIMEHPVITVLLLALFCEMFIESMSRSSFIDACRFIYRTPVKFILNYMIVLAPFLIALFVKKKLIPYVVFLAMWVTVGVTDYYMLSFRTTPFTGVDIDFDVNELLVAFNYLSPLKSIIILVILLAVILFIFSLVFICPNSKLIFNSRVKAFGAVLTCWFFIYGSIMFAINHDILSLKFGNLAITYHDEGIAYSLLVTIVDTGMSQPSDYSEDKVKDIVDNENKDEDKDNDDDKDNANKGDNESSDGKDEIDNNEKDTSKLPNIIFIQLESFIDPYEIKGLQLSQDPIPYFRYLRENYSSGYLEVPTIVAGTCNTEFEVISGMRLDSFGPGEYPYKTILKETTCESMAYDLKNIGYRAHAIHNNKATFYGRHMIYSHFGFDSFTSIENMVDVDMTFNGWAKDMVLVDSIMDCLESTDEKDLVYTVSVQCHGTYTTVLPDELVKIRVNESPDDELMDAFTYYVNMEKEVDDFIRELTQELSNYDEDVVLVMYGDHIPGLGLTNESMKNNDIYTTEYVIWDNMGDKGLKKEDGNIPSYQIAANVFNRVNIHEGTLFKFHQERANDENQEKYQSDFYTLQYDILYGDRYVYDGQNPFEATDIEFGVKDIIIDKITPAKDEDGDDCIYIEGERFNKFSKVFIDDKKEDCELISSSLLRVDINVEDIEEGSQIIIKQINSAGDVLRESEALTYIE